MRDFAGAYREVVGLLLDRRGEARSRLAEVPGRPETFSRARGRGVPRHVQLAVFRRDGFCCRYCGRKVVLPPVLRLLSIPFAEVFPYHLYGRMSVTLRSGGILQAAIDLIYLCVGDRHHSLWNNFVLQRRDA